MWHMFVNAFSWIVSLNSDHIVSMDLEVESLHRKEFAKSCRSLLIAVRLRLWNSATLCESLCIYS